MKFFYTIVVICPICGYHNTLTDKMREILQVREGHPFIITCDSDEGGCDSHFAVVIKLTHKNEVFKLVGPQ